MCKQHRKIWFLLVNLLASYANEVAETLHEHIHIGQIIIER